MYGGYDGFQGSKVVRLVCYGRRVDVTDCGLGGAGMLRPYRLNTLREEAVGPCTVL